MPRYEYRCRECGELFEMARPMAESSAPASCPAGHSDTVKLLSTVAMTGGAGRAAAPAPAPSAGGGGGGCCGGGCCG